MVSRRDGNEGPWCWAGDGDKERGVRLRVQEVGNVAVFDWMTIVQTGRVTVTIHNILPRVTYGRITTFFSCSLVSLLKFLFSTLSLVFRYHVYQNI